MRITPLDIKQKTFEKEIRGFSKNEVTSFLLMLSQEWDRMIEEIMKLKDEVEKQKATIEKYREVESALHRTLLQAEEQSKTTIDNAVRESELKMKETSIKAGTIIRDAEEKAKKLTSEAENTHKDIMTNANNEKKIIDRELVTLSQKRDDFVFQIKSLLNMALDQISRIESMNIPVVKMADDNSISRTKPSTFEPTEKHQTFQVTPETFQNKDDVHKKEEKDIQQSDVSSSFFDKIS